MSQKPPPEPEAKDPADGAPAAAASPEDSAPAGASSPASDRDARGADAASPAPSEHPAPRWLLTGLTHIWLLVFPLYVAAFVAENLSAARFAEYLADPDRAVFVARDRTRILGYAMLIHARPTDPDVLAALPEGPFSQRCELLTAASLTAVVTPLRGRTGAAPAAGAAPAVQIEHPRVVDLVAYGRLIDHFHARCTTIPIRFGCVLSDRAAVERHLGERAADYQRLLAELDGAVEVAVRMPLQPAPAASTPPPAPPAPPGVGVGVGVGVGAGTAYLRAQQARLAQEQQRTAHAAREAEWLRAALAAGTRAQAFSLKPLALTPRPGEPATAPVPPVPPVPTISVSLLVERGRLPALRQRVSELAAERAAALRIEPERALTLHGPFPPYSFVQLDPGSETK